MLPSLLAISRDCDARACERRADKLDQIEVRISADGGKAYEAIEDREALCHGYAAAWSERARQHFARKSLCSGFFGREFDANPVRIPATPTTVNGGFFDAATPAVAEVPSGAEIVVDTISGEPQDLPDDPAFTILPEHREILEKAERGPGPHHVTGPVAVAGARAGDVLQVDILECRSARTGAGI